MTREAYLGEKKVRNDMSNKEFEKGMSHLETAARHMRLDSFSFGPKVALPNFELLAFITYIATNENYSSTCHAQLRSFA